MKFVLNEDGSDITYVAEQLRAAEQAGKALPAATRALIGHAARMLHECRSSMLLAVEELEKGAAMRAGMMDSEGRHTEIARRKDAIMVEQAQFFRLLLTQATPRKRDEVI